MIRKLFFFLKGIMIFKIFIGLTVFMLFKSTESRTIRTRIYTNENGTKELILDKNSDLPQHEIDFLTQDLNNITVSTEVSILTKELVVKEEDEPEELKVKEEDRNVEKVLIRVVKKNETKALPPPISSDDILMKHWNSLTEVGWNNVNFRRPVKKMYINNTRILKFGPRVEITTPTTTTTVEPAEPTEAAEPAEPAEPEEPAESDLDQIESRKMDLEEDIDSLPGNETDTNTKIETDSDSDTDTEKANNIFDLDEPPKSRSIWDIFSHLYQCVEHYTVQKGLFKCLSMRVGSLFYPYGAKSSDDDLKIEDLNSNLNETSSRRTTQTIFHSKRFMYNVLLPLLVTIIIKYLLALPFIVLGILTTKTFWLSLLSAGAVTFGDLMKKRDFNFIYNRSPVSKKFGQVQGSGVVEVNSVPPGSNLYWSQLPVPWSVSKSDNRVVRMIPIDDKFYM